MGKTGKLALAPSYLTTFCMELSLILRAGIAMPEGVAMLASDEPSPKVRRRLELIKTKLEDGESVSGAFAASGLFSKYMQSMLRAGEKTGRLEEVFAGLSGYFDRADRISKTVRSAVFYPLLLLIMLLFVALVLVMRVLPIFADVYANLGGEMSGLAEGFLRFGEALGRNWPAVLGVFGGVLLAGAIFYGIPALRKRFHIWLGGRRFAFGLGRVIERSRFASGMALALAAGLSPDESLSLSGEIVTDRALLSKIGACRESIKNGEAFGAAIKNAEIFSALQSQMLIIGFRTGSADAVMAEIARRCEEEAGERTEAALARIEPTLVIIMSLLVGAILLSVMLPLTTIMSAM